jgi:alpha-D-xyloside xylohydrolase
MFRSHGTDASREIWRFGDEGSPFYEAIAKFIRLRYSLLPYMYSLFAAVTRSAAMMMRALPLAFPRDPATHEITDQYLFGPALMICPVTSPMYYERNSTPILNVLKTRPVYLPSGAHWYDFWTHQVYAGGQTLDAAAPLETMPIYVRAGSIVPMSEVMQYVDEIPDAPYEIRVYRGADADFTLYEDAGDGYAYEQGEFSLIRISWNEQARELSIAERAGTFPSMIEKRDYRIVFLCEQAVDTQTIQYTGQFLLLRPSL